MKRYELAFGAARDRAGDVELGARGAAAGEHERRDRIEGPDEPVDLLLGAGDVPGLDPMLRGRSTRRRRQLRLGDEQLVLQAQEDRREVRSVWRQLARGAAQMGAQLVERAERREAGSVLGYAGAAQETGLAAVAGTGVDPRSLASGRPGSASSGELRPWTGQNEMWSTSLCLAS